VSRQERYERSGDDHPAEVVKRMEGHELRFVLGDFPAKRRNRVLRSVGTTSGGRQFLKLRNVQIRQVMPNQNLDPSPDTEKYQFCLSKRMA